MNYLEQKQVLKKRAVRAVLSIAAALGVLLVSDKVFQATHLGVEEEIFDDVVQDMKPKSITNLLEHTPSFECDEMVLPADFIEEVGVCRGCSDIRISELQTCGVVGFVVSSPVQDVYDSFHDQLVEKGWTCTDSGIEGCGSFSKASGAYRWLFVSCVGVEGVTSVVVQYAT